jgi:hypothetical protein
MKSQLSGPDITEALKRIGREASLIHFIRQGVPFYIVVAQTDPDDRLTAHAVSTDDDGHPVCAQREPWQRNNVVLAIEPTEARALWAAEHHDCGALGLTLWFERTINRYDIGRRAPRDGASGRPRWAERAYETEGGLLV